MYKKTIWLMMLFVLISSASAYYINEPFFQNITITNNGASQTDFEVRLNLNSSLVGTNFNWSRYGEDLRFTNTSGVDIPFWIIPSEWNITSNTSIIWLKIANFTNTTNNIIHMYYGNTSLTNISNLANTFYFADDMDNSSKWTNRTGAMPIFNGTLNLISNVLYNNFTTSDMKHATGMRVKSLDAGADLRVEEGQNFGGGDEQATTIGYNNPNIQAYYSAGWNTITAYSISTYQRLEFTNLSDANNKYSCYVNDINYLNASFRNTTGLIRTINLYETAGDTIIDWLYIRKWQPETPSMTFSAEQSNSVPDISITWHYPTNNTQFNANSLIFNFTAVKTYTTGEVNCSLYINGTINDTLYNISNTSVMNFTQNYSSTTEKSFLYSINCSNNDTSSLTEQRLIYIDNIYPTITWINPSSNNVTIVHIANLTSNITIADSSLYSYQYNITYTNGTSIYAYSFNNLTGTSTYTIKNTSNMTTYGNEFYASVQVCDGHTANELSLLNTPIKAQNQLIFNDIAIKSLNSTKNLYYSKKTDRYTFSFEYATPMTEISIEMPKSCRYIGDKSNYKGHFICQERFWADFEGDYDVYVKGQIVTIKSKIPLTLWNFNSIGELNCINQTIKFYSLNYSVDYQHTAISNDILNFTFSLGSVNSSIYNSSASIVYNGTSYSATEINDTLSKDYVATLTIPNVSATTNVTFYFNYTINGVNYNSVNYTQTIYYLTFYNNCSAINGTIILNATLYDEESGDIIGDSNLTEIDFNITSSAGVTWKYHNSSTNGNIVICVENTTFNLTDYDVDFMMGYSADNHVQEFYYLDDGDLNSNCTFNSHTNCTIGLYDLNLSDSTTFLFKFYDENGLSVDNAIIHTYKKYIGNGTFKEVERSRQDNNGETHVHLVEEDVIYYFMVTQYGDIIYTSDLYNAKCISTPCQIELSAQEDYTEFPVNWTSIDGVSYSITSNSSTRITTLSFISNSSVMINYSVWKYDNNIPTLINNSNTTGTSGNISLHVPTTYGNVTFFSAIFKDSEFVESEWIDFKESAQSYFGKTGAILGGLLILTLSLMAVTEGIISIIITIIALIMIYVLYLIDLSWLSLISIVCAGGIIVWKLLQKR